MSNWIDKTYDRALKGWDWASKAATERVPNSLNLHARGALGVASALGSAVMGGAALYGLREGFNAGVRMDPLRKELDERGELQMNLGRGRFSSNAYWGRSMGMPWDHTKGIIGRAMKEPFLTDGQLGKDLELSPLQRAGYTALSAATNPMVMGLGVGAAGLYAARRAYRSSVLSAKELDLTAAQDRISKEQTQLGRREALTTKRLLKSGERLKALGVNLSDDFAASPKGWETAEKSLDDAVKSQSDPAVKKALEKERERLQSSRQKAESVAKRQDFLKAEQEALPDHVTKYNEGLRKAKEQYAPKPKPPASEKSFLSFLRKPSDAAAKLAERFAETVKKPTGPSGPSAPKPPPATAAEKEAARKARNVAHFSDREKAAIEAKSRQEAIGRMREKLYDEGKKGDPKTWTPGREKAQEAAERGRTEDAWKKAESHERQRASRWAEKEGKKQGWTKTKQDQMQVERLDKSKAEFFKKTADLTLVDTVDATAKKITQEALERGKGLIRRGVEGAGKSLRSGKTAALFGGAAVAIGAVASIGAGIGALGTMLEDESVDHALNLARLNPNTNMQGADYSGGQVQGRPRDVEEVMSFSGRGPRGLSGMNLGASGDLTLALHHLRKG